MRFLVGPLVFAVFILAVSSGAFAQDALSIGKVTRLQGSATQQLGSSQQVLQAGSYIHADALIQTGPKSRVEIVFIDASQLTLGEDARMRMDALVYSPNDDSGSGQQVLEVLSGTFRFLTGAIGRQTPEKVRIITPVATIGIRGTDLFGGPLGSGLPPGQTRYGVMLISGQIDVQTPQGAVTLDEPNEGTFVPLDVQGAPTEPGIWPQEVIDEAYASVSFQ
jgi:hypothetical protein